MTLSKNIRYLRKRDELSQDKLADLLGYKSYTTIQKWESGVSEPPLSKTYDLAKIFNVDIDELVNNDLESEFKGDNFRRIKMNDTFKIPVVGKIPAGVPIEAIEDVVEYVDLPADMKVGDNEYIGLIVAGDSMYPLFLDGDVVIIKLQASANNGDICACYVNGYNATLKRVKLEEGKIILKPENTNYPPKTYTHPGEVTIVGKVVEVRRKV